MVKELSPQPREVTVHFVSLLSGCCSQKGPRNGTRGSSIYEILNVLGFLTPFLSLCNVVTGLEKILERGLVEFVSAVDYLLCLKLPATVSQPRTSTIFGPRIVCILANPSSPQTSFTYSAQGTNTQHNKSEKVTSRKCERLYFRIQSQVLGKRRLLALLFDTRSPFLCDADSDRRLTDAFHLCDSGLKTHLSNSTRPRG